MCTVWMLTELGVDAFTDVCPSPHRLSSWTVRKWNLTVVTPSSRMSVTAPCSPGQNAILTLNSDFIVIETTKDCYFSLSLKQREVWVLSCLLLSRCTSCRAPGAQLLWQHEAIELRRWWLLFAEHLLLNVLSCPPMHYILRLVTEIQCEIHLAREIKVLNVGKVMLMRVKSIKKRSYKFKERVSYSETMF